MRSYLFFEETTGGVEILSKQDYNDEIELLDILILIWRRKLIILSFTGLVVILTCVVLFSSRDVYRASMAIEIVGFEQGIEGHRFYIDNPDNLKMLIDSNTLNYRVADKLGNENVSGNDFIFVTRIKKPTSQLIVSVDQIYPDIAPDILNLLVVALNEHYQSKIDSFVDTQKKMISQYELKREYEKSKREYEKSRIVDLNKKIKKVEEQYETLLEHGEKIVSGNSLDPSFLFDRISSVESRLDTLQNLLSNIEIAQMEKQLKSINAELTRETKNDSKFTNMEFIQSQIDRVNLIQADGKAIRSLCPPTVLPLTPKKITIVFAFGIGFLLSLLGVFFMEYLQKYKQKEHLNG